MPDDALMFFDDSFNSNFGNMVSVGGDLKEACSITDNGAGSPPPSPPSERSSLFVSVPQS